ncbi:MAG: hypothetical protein HQL24_00145 [Candidatus Omnitrophica bacterium]|nr:hypothetical protein [Candidatus Omnitrophota bacterium]
MLQLYRNKRVIRYQKPFIWGLIFFFSLSNIPFPQKSFAQNIPAAVNVLPAAAQAFQPVLIKGIKAYKNNPLKFDFILDKGEALGQNDPARPTGEQGLQLKQEASRLIKYFLASLTVPEEDLWVNLNPKEPNRIVPGKFGETQMGRDLLAQDYLLKQITSALMNPDGETGKKFWERIYREVYAKYGSTDIPVDTLNKVWIVPAKAVVYENPAKDAAQASAFVVEARLKVMLEEEYEALKPSAESRASAPLSSPQSLSGDPGVHNKATAMDSRLRGNDKKGDGNDMKNGRDMKNGSDISSSIIKEIIIPEIEKEVNTSKSFSPLRQVYNSLILATWYKRKLKESILGKVYLNKNKTMGVDIVDKQEKLKIYENYLAAFKKGTCNLIKEEYDPATKEIIPRKYFTGGARMAVDKAMVVTNKLPKGFMKALGVLFLCSSGLFVEETFAQAPVDSQQVSLASQKEHWMSLAKTNYAEVFQHSGEFINEPWAMDVLKAAILATPNGPFYTGSTAAMENFDYYLKYEKGWEFFRWMMQRYPEYGYSYMGLFRDKPYALRVYELLAELDPVGMVDRLTLSEYYGRPVEIESPYEIPENVLKQILAGSSSDRVKLVLAILRLSIPRDEKKWLARLAPDISSGKLTLEEAQIIVKDAKKYFERAVSVYQSQPPEIKAATSWSFFYEIKDFYLGEHLSPLYKSDKKKFMEEIQGLDAYRIYLILESFRGKASSKLESFDAIFPVFLQKVKAEKFSISQASSSAYSLMEFFSDINRNHQGRNLMESLSKEERLAVIQKMSEALNSRELFFYSIDRMKYTITIMSFIDDNLDLFDKNAQDYLKQVRAKLHIVMVDLIKKDIDALAVVDQIRDPELINLVRDMAFQKVKEPRFNSSFLLTFDHYISQPWGQQILLEILTSDPARALNNMDLLKKKYPIDYNNPLIMTFNQIASLKIKQSEKERLALLLDELVNKRLSLEEAQELIKDDFLLMRHLIGILSRDSLIGREAIKSFLSDFYLKFVREINKLHEQPDSVRFKSVEKATPEDLYKIIVFGEDEVYTSTFNGLFTRMIERMKAQGISGESGEELLNSAGRYKVRPFFRLMASFNRLNEFLATMSPKEQDNLIAYVVQSIEKEKYFLKEAAVVADIFSVVKDPKVLKKIQILIKQEFLRVQKDKNEQGMVLYGLLNGLFGARAVIDGQWFKDMANQFGLPDISVLSQKTLFNQRYQNIQRHFFYDDEDGKLSFADFLQTYQNDSRNWEIKTFPTYVQVTSKHGFPIVMYANLPDSVENGNAAIEGELLMKGNKPQVIVHHGHSYHVDKTIEKIDSAVTFVYLGSCGGFGHVSEILNLSPNAQIFSTKGTGTAVVNGPLFKIINDEIRQKGMVDWRSLWVKAEHKLGNVSELRNYMSPDRNLSVLFLKAYNKKLEELKNKSSMPADTLQHSSVNNPDRQWFERIQQRRNELNASLQNVLATNGDVLVGQARERILSKEDAQRLKKAQRQVDYILAEQVELNRLLTEARNNIIQQRQAPQQEENQFMYALARRVSQEAGNNVFALEHTDAAMITQKTPGGIDLNPQKMNLDIQGKGEDFTIPDGFEYLLKEDIAGFSPVIFDITPISPDKITGILQNFH